MGMVSCRESRTVSLRVCRQSWTGIARDTVRKAVCKYVYPCRVMYPPSAITVSGVSRTRT